MPHVEQFAPLNMFLQAWQQIHSYNLSDKDWVQYQFHIISLLLAFEVPSNFKLLHVQVPPTHFFMVKSPYLFCQESSLSTHSTTVQVPYLFHQNMNKLCFHFKPLPEIFFLYMYVYVYMYISLEELNMFKLDASTKLLCLNMLKSPYFAMVKERNLFVLEACLTSYQVHYFVGSQ